MNYQESLDFLYSRLPMFQRVGAAALKYDLTNTIRLMEALGNPHENIPCIHIAGTNGKGSSAHAIASVLTAAGYKTGLFTSPHLKSFTERARINGIEVSEDFVARFVSDHQQIILEINPSFFELTFALSMRYFKEKKVDIAVIETGLGGRLDSTNIINPIICLITSIGLDHTDLLGDTLEKIALEKAGIIKSETPVIIGSDQPEIKHVFINAAKNTPAPISFGTNYHIVSKDESPFARIIDILQDGNIRFQNQRLDITADYFIKNLPGIFTVIDQLQQNGYAITESHISHGLENINKLSGLKGRFQLIKNKPLTIADISHNQPGLVVLFEQIKQLKYNELHLIFGVVKDKSIDSILELLKTLKAEFYWTQSSVPRSMSAKDLKISSSVIGLEGASYNNVNLAIEKAMDIANEDDLILICGSTFVVAEIDNL